MKGYKMKKYFLIAIFSHLSYGMETNSNAIEPFNQIPDEIILNIMQHAANDSTIGIRTLLTISKRFAQFTADVQDVVLNKLAKQKHRTKFSLAIDHTALAWIQKNANTLNFNAYMGRCNEDCVLPLTRAVFIHSLIVNKDDYYNGHVDKDANMKLIHYLLQQGAYIDHKLSFCSPLYHTFHGETLGLAEYLIEYGALMPQSEPKPSMLAILVGCFFELDKQLQQAKLVKKLVAKGFSPFDEWWPGSGKTIIEKAKENRFNEEMVAYFESLEKERFEEKQ